MPFDSETGTAPEVGFRAPTGIEPPVRPDPTGSQIYGAAFRQDNTVVSEWQRLQDQQNPPLEGHDPLGIIRDTKYADEHLDRFIAARSPADTYAIMARIDREEEDRRTLDAAGMAGTVAQVAAGTIDPTILLPGGALYRSVKGGYAVARSATSVALASAAQAVASEGILQSSQETRSLAESALSVGSATILGGVIGTGAASLLTRAERKALTASVDQVRADIDAHASGAAVTSPPLVPEAVATPTVADTRGGGRQYHGTAQSELKLDDSHYSTLNYYGQGFYTTDATDIAQGYAKNRSKRGGSPTVFEIKENRPLTILDGEAPIGPDIEALLRKNAEGVVLPSGRTHVSSLDGIVTDALNERPKNLRDLYDKIRENATNEDMSADVVQEMFDGLNSSLRTLGFDGLSHAGGIQTKKPAHRVVIYFNPQKDITVAKLPPSEAMAQVSAVGGGSNVGASAGAAATDTRTLELDAVAKNLAPGLSVTRRVLARDSVEGRRVMADLAEIPYQTVENAQGIATSSAPSVERLARMQMTGTRVEISDELHRLFSDYHFGSPDTKIPGVRAQVERFMGRGEGKMTYAEFKQEVSKAAMNGDIHDIPQVAQAAQVVRAKVFEPWAARAETAVEGFKRNTPIDGEGYFPHVWNKEKVRAQLPEFVNKLTDLYHGDQVKKAAAKDRLTWFNSQLGSWEKQISKLEARFGRAEERAKQLDARAAERSSEANRTGDRAEQLYDRQNRLKDEASDLQETVDFMKDAKSFTVSNLLKSQLARLETKLGQRDTGAAVEAEAMRSMTHNERRLANLEKRLSETEERKSLIEETMALASEFRNEVRAKIEAELGAWDGKSAAEAKAAIKSREQYAKDTARDGEAERLQSADAAIDRTVRRIIESDRDLSVDELRSKAHETANRILGSPDGRLPYDSHTGGPRIGFNEGPPPRASLAARQLDVSNAWARDWIEQDIEEVANRHLRTLVPDVLISERFGDVEMSDAFRRVNEDYSKLIDQTKSEKERNRLGKERDATIRDMAAVRDRLRGVYGWSPDTRNMARVAAGVKAFNNITNMGVSAISSLPDLAGVVFRNGFTTAFSDGWAPFFRAMAGDVETRKGLAAAKSQWRAVGIGVETAINARQHAFDDVMDVYKPQSRFERTLQAASDKMFVANLLAPLTDFQKTVAANVSAAEILRAAKATSEGKATQRQVTNLAAASIDPQMAGRIWAQYGAKGGEEVGGVHLPNTADWTDRAAADSLNAAVSREVDIAVVTPGQEKPLWMSQPVVGLLGQFKAFTASATERIVIANLQRRDAAVLSGLVFSMGLGMMSYKVNALAGGQPVSEKPADWFKEGVSRSGLLGWFEEGNALASKATRGSVDIYRMMGAGKPLSRYAARSALDMLLGPTAGKMDSLFKVTGAAGSADWGESDTKALRRLIPFQNLLWLRRGLNEVEEQANSAFGVQ